MSKPVQVFFPLNDFSTSRENSKKSKFVSVNCNGRMPKKKSFFPFSRITLAFFLLLALNSSSVFAQRAMEKLDRGVVALQRSKDIYLSWRMFGTEPSDVAYHVYRNGVKITISPISNSTNYVDAGGRLSSTYAVAAVINGQEQSPSPAVSVWAAQPGVAGYESKASYPFKVITLPAAPTDPDFPDITYSPEDMNVGDLTGDGKYELVFEWVSSSPSNTHLRFFDAIDLEGNLLWRVNAGRNIDKIAHIVYDLDMDGKAEVAFKSGPGSKDGLGNYLSKGPAATDDDSRLIPRRSGRLGEDPAYVTVLDGQTGAEKTTVRYPFDIGPDGGRTDGWGDNYGHRASSIKACVIWVEGRPLLVYTRGIYLRMGLAAYSFDGSELSKQWSFDTNDPLYSHYEGEGNHSLSVGDVDGDGHDEIIYGACAIDHDGKGLYATGRGHGDADHLADHDPDRPGLEFFQPHENSTYGVSFRDAGTGEIIWEYLSPSDVGRAWAADVYEEYRGSEMVSTAFENMDRYGDVIPTTLNAFNQPIYWDGRVQRDWRGGTTTNSPGARHLTGYYYGAQTIHGSKNDANLVADILGDWREEIIMKRGKTELLIFSTTIPTTHKNYTLMHDPLYRMNIVRQNIGYNQPAHTGYFFADGPPVPNIYLIGGSGDPLSSSDLLNSEKEAMVYPNPSSDKFIIEATGAFDYTITDQLGRIVAKGKGDGQLQVGDELSSGVYLVLITTKRKTERSKIVKLK